jgi:hypothetical protein
MKITKSLLRMQRFQETQGCGEKPRIFFAPEIGDDALLGAASLAHARSRGQCGLSGRQGSLRG